MSFFYIMKALLNWYGAFTLWYAISLADTRSDTRIMYIAQDMLSMEHLPICTCATYIR